MKKYVKPELFYERFELSQHIADCQWEFKNSSSESACAAHPDQNIPGSPILFLSTSYGCDENSANAQIYCYQPGADGMPKVAVS